MIDSSTRAHRNLVTSGLNCISAFSFCLMLYVTVKQCPTFIDLLWQSVSVWSSTYLLTSTKLSLHIKSIQANFPFSRCAYVKETFSVDMECFFWSACYCGRYIVSYMLQSQMVKVIDQYTGKLASRPIWWRCDKQEGMAFFTG